MDLNDLLGAPGVMPEDPGRGRVLIVDDDPANRVLMSRLLRRAGYECAAASSTEEARALLSKEAYGLLFTDLRMFTEDGLELVRQVADRYPTTYSILVTGWVEDGLEQRVRQAGGFALVEKPVDAQHLVALAAAAFEDREKKVALHRHRGDQRG